jgi:hypothetical protein
VNSAPGSIDKETKGSIAITVRIDHKLDFGHL